MIMSYRRLFMIETIMGVPNYVDDDTNLDHSGFKSKTPMMYREIFTTKLCAVIVPLS